MHTYPFISPSARAPSFAPPIDALGSPQGTAWQGRWRKLADRWRAAASVLILLISLCALTGLTATSAQAAGFGIGDGPGAFNSYYNNCWFQALTTSGCAGHSGPIGYVRFFAPWDTVGYSTSPPNSSPSCAASPAFNNGSGSSWNTLVQEIHNAATDHLTVMVSIAAGTTIGGLPYAPTDNDYYCGLTSLMSWLTTPANAHVSEWEVYNEPEGQFPGTNKFGDTGAAAAADLYVDALFARADAGSGDVNDTLVAGAFNDGTMENCCAYMDGYLAQMDTIVQSWGYPAPGAFSGHPYTDIVDGASTIYSGTVNLQSQLDIYAFNSSPVWLTEAADWLDDPANTGSDGNGTAQANAASAFLQAPSITGIARIYWYQYQSSGAGFDSALVGPDGAGRPSYCVLYGTAGSNCTSHYMNQWGQTTVPLGFWGVNATSNNTYQCSYSQTPTGSDQTPTPAGQVGQSPTNTDALDITSTTDSVNAACADSWGY
jgi:hypothetical protein